MRRKKPAASRIPQGFPPMKNKQAPKNSRYWKAVGNRKNSSFPIQSVRQVSLPGHEIQDLLLGRGVSEGSGLPVVGAAGVDAAGDQAGLLFCDLALVDGEQHLINNRPVLWMAVPAVAEVAQRIDNFRAVVDLPGLEDVGMVANNECYHLQKDRNYEIDWFRIAPYKLLAKPTYYTAMRCILINSFAFLTIIYDESGTIKSDEVENEILRSHPNFIKLNRGNKAVLKKDKIFWLETFETNKVLRDNFLVKRKSKKDDVIKIIQLSREEIENKDYSR